MSAANDLFDGMQVQLSRRPGPTSVKSPAPPNADPDVAAPCSCQINESCQWMRSTEEVRCHVLAPVDPLQADIRPADMFRVHLVFAPGLGLTKRRGHILPGVRREVRSWDLRLGNPSDSGRHPVL